MFTYPSNFTRPYYAYHVDLAGIKSFIEKKGVSIFQRELELASENVENHYELCCVFDMPYMQLRYDKKLGVLCIYLSLYLMFSIAP